LCKLLGPGDFTAVGVTDATGPSENPTDPLNTYCVYRGTSDFTNINLTGADQGLLSLPNSATSTDPALIAIQAGKLTYAIGMGVPFADALNEKAADKLVQLATLVFQRGAVLGS
jgi:hypothetical protein